MHSLDESQNGKARFSPNVESLDSCSDASFVPAMGIKRADCAYEQQAQRDWESVVVNPRVASKGRVS